MPFAYYDAELPKELTRTFAARADQALRTEVQQRAALLKHLGYSQKETAARCTLQLAWEYELHPKPAVLKEVDALVAKVFSHRG